MYQIAEEELILKIWDVKNANFVVKLLFSLCSERYFNETWHLIGIFYGQSTEIIRNVVTYILLELPRIL